MRTAVLGFFNKHAWDITQVLPPHGAVSGCDPYTAYSQLDDNNFFGYMHKQGNIFVVENTPENDTDPQSGALHRAFHSSFGMRKCPRLGENDAFPVARALNDGSNVREMERCRKALRTKMSQSYSNIAGMASDDTRVIVLCFCYALPIMLDRFVEVAQSLHNVSFIGIPYADDIEPSVANGARPDDTTLEKLHRVTYTQYMSMFSSRASSVCNAIRNEFQTIRTLVVSYGSEHWFELLQHQRYRDATDVDGTTLLHVAVALESSELAMALIDSGADINAVDHNNETALHWAASLNSECMAILLIDSGIDTSIRSVCSDCSESAMLLLL
jgi:hypothetical protein